MRLALTASAGLCTNTCVHTEASSSEHLIACADEALYQAKADGRNCVRQCGRTITAVTPR